MTYPANERVDAYIAALPDWQRARHDICHQADALLVTGRLGPRETPAPGTRARPSDQAASPAAGHPWRESARGDRKLAYVTTNLPRLTSPRHAPMSRAQDFGR